VRLYLSSFRMGDLPQADAQIAGRGRGPRRLALQSKNLLLPTEVFLAQANGTSWVHRRTCSSLRWLTEGTLAR
jgi:hypothetical protein